MTTEHAVLIAGEGPTGMMLAAELTLAGVDVAVVERRTGDRDEGSRSGGLHARTIEVLDQRGVADRFLAEGRPMQVAQFATVPLDMSDFPTRHPYGLALWQNRFEEILGDWVVGELGVPVLRGREVVGLAQDAAGVDMRLAGGGSLRAAYLVGCDGGRSAVRKAAGIAFTGWEATTSSLVAEGRFAEEPEWGVRRDAAGTHGIGPLEDGRARMVVTDGRLDAAGPPTLADLSAALVTVFGSDYGVHDAWISRFTDAARQAESYRAGRVLLAGDAAHVHSPVGGQGLNTGVQDAVNLGWKLAQVVHGTSSEDLLDTYHAERHPVAARVLRATLSQAPLLRSDDRIDALRDAIADLVAMDEPRVRLAGMMSGLDIAYDLGGGHPLIGRRMPDLDLETAEGPTTVFSLLHDARPLVIVLGDPAAAGTGPSAGRVRRVHARCGGPWELPVIGAVPAPAAVAVRPDGHVAWAGDPDDPALADALTAWFGPAAAV